MKKKKNFKQIIASTLLFLAGLLLGLAIGLLLIPKMETLPVEIPETLIETQPVDIKMPFLGNAESKIQIVEYTDFECPFCREYYKDIFNGIISDYINNEQIGYTFKDYPLELYEHNIKAALTAYCAAEQNNFWPMHSKLFENQETWSKSENPLMLFKNFAQDLKLDLPAFDNCLQSQKFLNVIQKNINSAHKFNVRLTPTIFVNDIIIQGLQSPEYYQQIIDSEILRVSIDVE